jgi:hypothetical protein
MEYSSLLESEPFRAPAPDLSYPPTRCSPPRTIVSISPSASFSLLVDTLAIHAQTLHFPFVQRDDPAYVTRKEHVLTGFTRENLSWALSNTQEINWHPVTWLSHMLDVELFGLDPRGHHGTSVLLHAMNSLLIFALLIRTTGAKLLRPTSPLLSRRSSGSKNWLRQVDS